MKMLLTVLTLLLLNNPVQSEGSNESIRRDTCDNVFKGYFDHYKETPLMLAVIAKDVEKTKEHIAKGEDVNAVCGQDWPHAGSPVLRYAIDTNSLEIVQAVLQAGANPNCLTESPVMTEQHRGNVRNISLLSHAINKHAPLDIIAELINAGAHVDGSPKYRGDWSALMIAAHRGYLEAVLLLLSNGADKAACNSKDSDRTACDYAKEAGHLRIVEILNQAS